MGGAGVGSSGSGGQDWAFKIEGDGDSKIGNSSGDLHQITGTLAVTGDIKTSEYIKHLTDTDTFIRFEADTISLEAGGEAMIYCVEGSGGDQADKVTINNDSEDVDFQVKGTDWPNLLRTDAVEGRVGIGLGAETLPTHTLTVAGIISASHGATIGNLILNDDARSLTLSGTISSSAGATFLGPMFADDINVSGTLSAATFSPSSVSGAVKINVFTNKILSNNAIESSASLLAKTTVSGAGAGSFASLTTEEATISVAGAMSGAGLVSANALTTEEAAINVAGAYTGSGGIAGQSLTIANLAKVSDGGVLSSSVGATLGNLILNDDGTSLQLSGASTFVGVATHTGHPLFNSGITIKNADASAGYINFFEQSSNGTNVCTFRGKSSMGNCTITLPGNTGTVVLEDNTVTLSNKTITSPVIDGDGISSSVGSTLGNLILNDDATSLQLSGAISTKGVISSSAGATFLGPMFTDDVNVSGTLSAATFSPSAISGAVKINVFTNKILSNNAIESSASLLAKTTVSGAGAGSFASLTTEEAAISLAGAYTGSGGIAGQSLTIANLAKVSDGGVLSSSVGATLGNLILNDDATSLQVSGNVYFGEYIYHAGDTNTYIRFEDDSIKLFAGNVGLMKLHQGSQDTVLVNNGGNDVDFQVNGNSVNNIIRTIASSDRVGIGTNEPGALLGVGGVISSSHGATLGNLILQDDARSLTLSGTISSSAGATFLGPVFADDINASGSATVSEWLSFTPTATDLGTGTSTTLTASTGLHFLKAVDVTVAGGESYHHITLSTGSINGQQLQIVITGSANNPVRLVGDASGIKATGSFTFTGLPASDQGVVIVGPDETEYSLTFNDGLPCENALLATSTAVILGMAGCSTAADAASTMFEGLSAGINGASWPFTAANNGTTVSLTASTAGTAGNQTTVENMDNATVAGLAGGAAGSAGTIASTYGIALKGTAGAGPYLQGAQLVFSTATNQWHVIAGNTLTS